MHGLIDIHLPWLGDLLALGGDVLLTILVVTVVLWTLICERLLYLWLVHPARVRDAARRWQSRPERRSWYARQERALLISRVSRALERHQDLIRTLVMMCPLLGLLGTVVGMLEVFQVVAVTGTNSARATAAGVSKATVSTMAGMVVALSGLMVSAFLKRRSAEHRQHLAARLPLEGT